ncbi:MAG: hypothetical protein QOC71_28 [Thermoplasmata archaeon]|jgi:hypothetical protein|nr:hypothetical protein [Thermoplasmata archaeon]
MDLDLLAATAWTTGVLGAGAFLLYAVGGLLDHADILLLLIGAAPVTAFGVVAFGRAPRNVV